MKHLLFVIVILCSATAMADDLAAIEKARTLCAGCHGPQGVSVNPIWPNLAGQHAPYLAKSLRDYKSGQRNDPSMSPLATTLSESEIDALASYYQDLPLQ